jgi:hypothetical protein
MMMTTTTMMVMYYWLRMAGALLNTIMNFWVPSKAENLLTNAATMSFSRNVAFWEHSYPE